MKRKIIKLAEKTLVVSLPSNWVLDQGLDKGDELDVDIEGYKLILTPPKNLIAHKSTTLDVKGVTERMLRWQISSLHKQGYDEIVVVNYTDNHYEIIDDLVKNLFVGFIIKDRTNLRVVVGQVAAVDADEFDSTLRRAFRQLNAMAQDTFVAFDNKDLDLLQKQINNEKQNNKLTNFCERLLNKSLKEKNKGHFWYVIAWNLEKIADNYKYIAESYNKKVYCEEETLELFKKVNAYLNSYTELLYDLKSEKLVELTKQKKELDDLCLKLLSKGTDSILVHYLHMVVLQTADFSASIIAISKW